MRAALLVSALLLALVSRVQSHGHLSVPAARDSDRPIYQMNAPVAKPLNSEFVCRNHAALTPTVTLTAGTTSSLTWDFSANHVGDCFLYLSYDIDKPDTQQRYFKIAQFAQCNLHNQQSVSYSVPSFLPACDHCILRWEWYALHNRPNIEFYAQCVDVKISSTIPRGGPLPTPQVTIPGNLPQTCCANNEYRDAFDAGSPFFFTGPALATMANPAPGVTAVSSTGSVYHSSTAVAKSSTGTTKPPTRSSTGTTTPTNGGGSSTPCATGQFSCHGTGLAQCAFGIWYNLGCPGGTQCYSVSGMALCLAASADTVDMNSTESEDVTSNGAFYTPPAGSSTMLSFSTYDSNGDGVLEPQEFETVLRDSENAGHADQSAATCTPNQCWKMGVVVAFSVTAVFLGIGTTVMCRNRKSQMKKAAGLDEISLKSVPASPLQSPESVHRQLVPPTSPNQDYRPASSPPLPTPPTSRPLPQPPSSSRPAFQSPINLMRGLPSTSQTEQI